MDFIVVDVRRTDVDVRPNLKGSGVVEPHIRRHPITPGCDPWGHQLACADVLSAAPDVDLPSCKNSDCDFPLFFVAREGHTPRRMA